MMVTCTQKLTNTRVDRDLFQEADGQQKEGDYANVSGTKHLQCNILRAGALCEQRRG
jgi:hypothetical protein